MLRTDAAHAIPFTWGALTECIAGRANFNQVNVGFLLDAWENGHAPSTGSGPLGSDVLGSILWSLLLAARRCTVLLDFRS